MAPRKSKPGRKAPVRTKARKARSTTNVSEQASLSCSSTLTVGAGLPNATVTDTMFNFNTFNLARFPRAVQVAQGYQFYRISGIKLTFKPAYDTYQQNAPGAAANTQKPVLYYMIDKADAIPTNITLEGLKNMGARPHAFDEKPISVTWKPSVLNSVENAVFGAGPGQYKISPWLNTNDDVGAIAVWNPSTVAHKGIKWYMEQPGAGVGETTVYVECELQFEFKKALIANMVGDYHAVQMTYPTLDRSPDGIVGGSDQ